MTFTADSAGAAMVIVELADGESAKFQKLPIGATYIVSEAASGYIASYTVKNDEAAGNVAGKEGANTSADLALTTSRETVDSGEEITITFENDSEQFKISFNKKDDGGMFVVGARLQIKSGDTVIRSFNTGSGEQVFTGVLEVLTQYTLHEVSAPDGYLPAEDVQFFFDQYGQIWIGTMVLDANGALSVNGDGVPYDGSASAVCVKAGDNCITVEDPYNIKLPETGGLGTLPYMASGMFLLLLSAAARVLLCRKEEKMD